MPKLAVFFLLASALSLGAIDSSCATTKDAAVEVAKECSGPVAPLVVATGRDASLAPAEADLPLVLSLLKDCVARLAAEEVARELLAIGAEPGVMAQADASSGGVTVAVARARVEAWLLAHGGPA